MSCNCIVLCRRAAFVALCVSLSVCLGRTGLAQNPDLQLRGPTEGLRSEPINAEPRRSQPFRGSGTLYRVKSNDTGAERYALMDNTGRILAFLAPSSRFDLQSYIGANIGIQARTFGNNDDVAPYVIVEQLSAAGSGLVDSAVRTAGHEQPLEPVRASAGASEPAWRVAANGIPGPYNGVPGAYDGVPGAYDGVPGAFDGVPEPYLASAGGVPCADGSCGGVSEYYPGPGGCGLDDCTACTSCETCGIGMPCCCPPPPCGPPGWLFLRGEYLLWYADGMDLPPLVTTSPNGTPVTDAGVLGDPGTEIVYGNESVLQEGRSGYRILFGGFLGPQKCFGWEGEYLDLGRISDVFEASCDGNGSPILSRPFFNTDLGDEDAELVCFPDLLRGTVMVDTFSNFNGAAGRFRWNKCCKRKCDPCPPCGPCGPCGPGGPYGGYGGYGCGYPAYCKIDFTFGYRYYGLDEGLEINEDLTSLQSNNPGRFEVRDTFLTRNDFHGGEIGTSYLAGWNRWTLEGLMRIAIGGTRQQVTIDGETTISPLVAPSETFQGGLLAQRSNIGTFERNQFSMIPEIGTNLGFYLSPRMRLMVGYTLIYWSNVVRPGDQIDLDVNPALIPPETVPFVGGLRPSFRFRDSDFWAHGLNVGLDYRW